MTEKEIEREIKSLTVRLNELRAKKRRALQERNEKAIRKRAIEIAEQIDLDVNKAFFDRQTVLQKYRRYSREHTDKKFIVFYVLFKEGFKKSYIADALNHNHAIMSTHMKDAEFKLNYPDVKKILEKVL